MELVHEPNVIQIHPKSVLEMTESPYKRFLIKFSAPNCEGCTNLQNFLDSGSLNPSILLPIYHVNVRDSQPVVYNDLKMFFKFKALPYCVVTDNSLEEIDCMCGYTDQEAFKAFIYKNFPQSN